MLLRLTKEKWLPEGPLGADYGFENECLLCAEILGSSR